MSDITDKITNKSMDDLANQAGFHHAASDASDLPGEDIADNVRTDENGNMYVTLDDEAIATRNRVLRQKKRGILTVVLCLALVIIFPIWFLQTQEQASPVFLWSITAILAAILLGGVGCYAYFAKQINRDMASNENRLFYAYVVSGWQINERRDPVIRLNVNNDLVSLSMNAMKRHIDHVSDLDRLMPGSELIVEMTQYARVIVRIARI